MFNEYPYTDYHELNTDWIIGKIKNVETAEANTKQYAEDADAAKVAAEDARDIAVSAKDTAVQAKDDAEGARDSAQTAENNARNIVHDTQDQINLLQSRVDNIIPDGTQTAGNTELLDIRVGENGITYDSAGNAVRNQIQIVQGALNGELEGVETFITHGAFAVGGLNPDGTLLPSQTSRVSSYNVDKLKFDRDITVSCKAGYRWGYIPFVGGTPGTWSGWYSYDVTVPANTEFVVQISEDPETSPVNVYDYVTALTFKTAQASYDEQIGRTDDVFTGRLASLDGYSDQIYAGNLIKYFASVYDYVQIKTDEVLVSGCDKFRVVADSYNSYGTRVMTITCKDVSDTTLATYAVSQADFSGCDYECAVPDNTVKIQIIYYANYTGAPVPSVGDTAYFNGIVYLIHSAGASDQTITTLVDRMDVVEDYVNTQKNNLNAFNVALGTLVNGVYNPATARAYTQDYIDCTYGLNIHMDQSGIKYGIHAYDADKNWVYSSGSWETGDINISNGQYAFVRINFAKSDDSDITAPGVAQSLASHITIWQNETWKVNSDIAYTYSTDGSLRTNKLMYNVNKTDIAFPAVADITVGTVTSFQDIAYSNGVVFQLYSNDVVVLADYTTCAQIAELTISSGHGDSIDFSNEYYNVSDEFPLAYITTDEDPTEAHVNIVRITRTNTALIKRLKFPLADTGYYAGHALDALNNIIYEVGYTMNSYDSDMGGANRIKVSAWDMSNLTLNADSTYTPALINTFTIPFYTTTQGQCFFDNKIAVVSSAQLSTDTKILFIDPAKQRIDFVLDDMPSVLNNYEAEGLAFAPADNKYVMLIKPNNTDLYAADFNS